MSLIQSGGDTKDLGSHGNPRKGRCQPERDGVFTPNSNNKRIEIGKRIFNPLMISYHQRFYYAFYFSPQKKGQKYGKKTFYF